MGKNSIKIALGDWDFACSFQDFGIFMPKHPAGQWLLNNLHYPATCVSQKWQSPPLTSGKNE